MKKYIKIICLILIICLITTIYYQNKQIVSLKKTIGHNLVVNFHTMRMTTIALNEYLSKNKQLDSDELYIYSGKIYKDMRLLRLIIKDDHEIMFNYMKLHQKLLDLINHIDDDQISIDKYKDDLMNELNIILNYHKYLNEKAVGDEIMWYNLYNSRKLHLYEN